MQNIILDTPRKREDSGVSFFNHFRKDFIRPYGLAHNENTFDPATLSRRSNNINCEFYLRPQIAISEFAETIPANLQYVEENINILDKESISALIRKTRKIEPYLKILDSKKRDENGMCITHYLYTYINISIQIYIYLYIFVYIYIYKYINIFIFAT